jgi:hypothetical protein
MDHNTLTDSQRLEMEVAAAIERCRTRRRSMIVCLLGHACDWWDRVRVGNADAVRSHLRLI